MVNYIRINYKWLLIAVICTIISTLFAVRLQFIKGDILNAALNQEFQAFIKLIFLIIVFVLIECIFTYFFNQSRARFTVACSENLRQDYFNSILNGNYNDFIKKNKGGYLATYTNDLELIKNMYFGNMTLIISLVIKVIFVSTSLFALNFWIAMITLLLLTMPLYIPKLVEKKLQNSQKKYIDAVQNNMTFITDWLSNFESIKIFGIEEKIKQLFKSTNTDVIESLWIDKKVNNFATLLTMLMSYSTHIVILIISAILVFKGYFTAGTFFVAISMIDQLSYPIISISNAIQNFISVKKVAESLYSQMTKYVQEADNQITSLYKGIYVKDVSFSYNCDHSLFENISFSFKKNQIYLIKGESGSGKTTLIDMLMGYQHCTSGQIMFDDIDVLHIKNPYTYITVIRQDSEIFNDTIRNNVTMFSDTYTDEQVLQVLKQVNLYKFAKLEELDSMISESGYNVSGGERKRICVARALLRNTDVLIFDEPLANLDMDTAEIMEDLLLSIENKLVIIISHSFSEKNLQRLDEILSL